MEDHSLTPEEVANILKITKYTVYEMVKRGDLPAYRIGRKIRIQQRDLEKYQKQGSRPTSVSEAFSSPPLSRRQESGNNEQGLVICGQDILLDVLGWHLEKHPDGCRVFRQNVGSFSGLLQLYQGQADIASVHLWDSDSDQYNIPYIRRLVPGIPTILVHLAVRLQGFYVAQGNPLNIKTWQDLATPGLRFINREPGCGTRILLDEQLYKHKLNRNLVEGYTHEETSHLAVASAVARGVGDVGLGNQKSFMQVSGIDFIPLQRERYELVMLKEDRSRLEIQTALDILRSDTFREELEGLGDYDLKETGRIVAEI